MKTYKRYKISLRWGLIVVVALCWLLPVIFIYAAMAFYVGNGVKSHLSYTTKTAVQSAVSAVQRNIEASVAASKRASYDPSVKNAYQEYKKNGDSIYLYNEVTTFLTRQYEFDDKFVTTLLFFVDEPDAVYHVSSGLMATQYADVLRYKRNAGDRIKEISEGLGTDIAFHKEGDALYMIRNIVDSNFEPYAVIVMQLNEPVIFSGFKNIAWETGATVYLNSIPVIINTDESGNAILFEGYGMEPYYGEPAVIDMDGGMFMRGGLAADDFNISFFLKIDRAGYTKEMFGFAKIFNIFVALLFPLLSLTIWFFYRNIFSPIRGLVQAVKKIEEGELGYQLEEPAGNIEFDYLTESFNGMSARLKCQFERIYSEELALRDARIMALQSQINPHFLNNTLEIVNWEARLQGNFKVSRMIESLSTMLDAALDRKSDLLTPLSQELVYVDAYLYIISERFGKRLEVEKRIDETLLRHKVPRLILQPIMENAVEHGVAVHQFGRIVLLAAANDGSLTLTVDNNCPMTEDDEAAVKRLLSPGYDAGREGSNQLGIFNVNQRLKMIYGETAGLTIECSDGHTISTIIIPLEQ